MLCRQSGQSDAEPCLPWKDGGVVLAGGFGGYLSARPCLQHFGAVYVALLMYLKSYRNSADTCLCMPAARCLLQPGDAEPCAAAAGCQPCLGAGNEEGTSCFPEGTELEGSTQMAPSCRLCFLQPECGGSGWCVACGRGVLLGGDISAGTKCSLCL